MWPYRGCQQALPDSGPRGRASERSVEWGHKGPPPRGSEVAPFIESHAPEGQRTMLYKLAIFASALLAGARAEVRSPCRTG